jgi:GntR family transcriptional regulator
MSLSPSVASSLQLPLHLTISEKLRYRIAEGDYQPEGQLPSEYQLMAEFGVSRITVRRAIANLVQQGLVMAQQGRGVFVKPQQKITYSLSSPMVFFETDMARQGVISTIQNLVFEPMLPPPHVQDLLRLPKRNKVYFQKKLLLLNGTPVAVDTSYTLYSLGKTLARDLERQMTFPTLEQHGVMIDKVETMIESTHASYDVSEYLDVPLGHPLIAYSYKAYNDQDQPIVCGEALSRGDRLCYSVVIRRNADRKDQQL